MVISLENAKRRMEILKQTLKRLQEETALTNQQIVERGKRKPEIESGISQIESRVVELRNEVSEINQRTVEKERWLESQKILVVQLQKENQLLEEQKAKSQIHQQAQTQSESGDLLTSSCRSQVVAIIPEYINIPRYVGNKPKD
jgi:chromosome segregation ATPase